MITKFKLFESINTYPTEVFHGAEDEHDFTKSGRFASGTFFSTDKHEAASYCSQNGKLYKVSINPNLNIFNTNSLEDCTKLIKEFGPLEDPYYDEDDEPDEFNVDTPEKLYHSNDSWSAIEKTEDCLYWLKSQYDGVVLFEGGIKNILLFKPVNEKIFSYEKIEK